MDAQLAEVRMKASTSRKADCRDNAPAGSFFDSLRNGRLHDTTCATRADMQAKLYEYIVLVQRLPEAVSWNKG